MHFPLHHSYQALEHAACREELRFITLALEHGTVITLVMNLEGILKNFQKFKLFFHENSDFKFFMANFHETFEPYIVVLWDIFHLLHLILRVYMPKDQSL